MSTSQNEQSLQNLDQRYRTALNNIADLYPKSKYYGSNSTASKLYLENLDEISNINAELLQLQNSVEVNNISLSSSSSRTNNIITVLENEQKKLKQRLSSLKGRKEGAQAMYVDSKLIYQQYYLGNWLLVLTMLAMGVLYRKNK